MLLLTLACHGAPSLPPVDSGQEALSACEPALSLSPESATLQAWELLQLHAEGGTGAYRFLADGEGEIGETTGAFVASGEPGLTEITLLDDGCLGQATAAVEVISALTLSPHDLRVEPGAAVAFLVEGGSGEWSCELTEDGSGAALDAAGCEYQAGAVEGVDRVRVTDALTGAEVETLVQVAEDATFSVQGHEYVFVPEGSTFTFEPVNGSGDLELEVLWGSVQVDGPTVTGGSGKVRVHDAFVDASVDVRVQSLAPIAPDAVRDGERAGRGTALAVGDLDGDGYVEALMGLPEASNAAHYSGQVLLYQGSADGLAPAPARVWSGATTMEQLGRGLAVGDVDNDGALDLFIGTGGMDRTATNNGGVHVFHGQAGQLWDEEPDRTLYGTLEYDRFGDALALCDFDADGWLDLAVGAPDSQDEAASDRSEEQGSVQVFRGGEAGFADKPDFVLWGLLPDGEGGWTGQESARVGAALAAGDFDGDGLCDLAAGAPDAEWDGGDDEGVVLVWRGTTVDNLMLEREPSALIAALDGYEGELGRSLAAGDVDGDGDDELLVSEWASDAHKTNAGAVHLFDALAMDGSQVPLEPSDAAWTVQGESSSDYFGTSVAVADLDTDGIAEVLVGGYRAEDDERTNQGVVFVFRGIPRDGRTESASTAAERILGPNRSGRFGQALAPVGTDGLLVLAGYDSSWGIQAGAAWYAPLDGSSPELLDFPGVAAGHEFGRALRLVDVDGDGQPELLYGAPGAGSESEGANAGLLYAFPWDGSAGEPELLLGGHHSWSSSDRYGQALATGDFDGDGREDLMVVARKDSMLSSLGSSYANPDECPEYRALAGSVLVYRGRASGFDADPTWIVHAPSSYDYIDVVHSGFDLDGDGRDEIAFGGTGWGSGGGFGVAYGRASGDGTLVLCDPVIHLGEGSFDRLGASMVSLGDLDGDGCDELAVGATGTEYSSDYYNQGIVHLLWGSSATCGSPQVSELSLRTVGAGIGSSLDARDVDGDGLMDLLVGGAERRADFAELGGVWVSPGSYLVDSARSPVDAGELPDLDSEGFDYLVPDDGLEGRHGLLGPSAGSLFGEAAAWLQMPSGRWVVAVGAPQASYGGEAFGGGVALYRYDQVGGSWGLEEVPFAILGAESSEGELGAVLAVHGATLLVGAPRSSALGVETGAAYAVSFEP